MTPDGASLKSGTDGGGEKTRTSDEGSGPWVVTRNLLTSWGVYAVTVVVSLLLTPFVLKGLGTHTYGVWLLFGQVAAYAALLDLGIQYAVVRNVAQAISLRDEKRLTEFLSTALVVYGALACVALAGMMFLSLMVDRVFDVGPVPPETARMALAILGVAAALAFPASLLAAALTGHQRLDLAMALVLAVQIPKAIGMVVAVQLGYGLMGLAVAALAGNVVGLAASWAAFAHQFHGVRLLYAHARRRFCPEILSSGAYSLVGAAGWRLAYGSDTVVIAAFLSAKEVAYFGVAGSVIALLSGVVSSVSGSIMPMASESHAAGDTEAIRRRFLAGTRVALFLGLPLAGVLLLGGPQLLGMWVGSEVGRPAGKLLQVLAVAHIFVIANSPAPMVAIGVGWYRASAGLAFAEGCVNVGLSLILVRLVGVGGVAIATLLACAAFQGLIWPFLLHRYLGFGWRRHWLEAWRPHLFPVLSFLAVIGVASRVSTTLPSDAALVAVLLFATAVYWVIGAFTCLTASERLAVSAYLPRALGRLRG